MPSRATNHPCTRPIDPPSSKAAITTSGQGRPACSVSATAALTSATVEPTDRSMPPVVITKVIATATIRSGEDWRNRFSRLISLMNASVCVANSTTITEKNAAILRTWACLPKKSWWRAPLGRRS